jgi:hypothetical protein
VYGVYPIPETSLFARDGQVSGKGYTGYTPYTNRTVD